MPAPVINTTETLEKKVQVADYEPVNAVESIVNEPAAKQADKETEAVPIAAPAKSTYTPPASNSRRLSKGMHSIDDEAIKAAASMEKVEKILSLETALQLFEDYKKQLQAANKNVIYAQFSMMRLEVLPPDEVRIISPSTLTDTYAKEQRNHLIDFYRSETNMVVRITMEIQEDEAVKAMQHNTVLSKSEIFEVMAQKNPSLAKLKDSLGLQLEY